MRLMVLTGRNFKEVYRDPLSISLGIAMPVALLILFMLIGKSINLDFFYPTSIVPGVIVFNLAFLFMFIGTLLIRDRKSAFLNRLLTSPLKSWEFIFAYSLPFIPIALAQVLICIIAGIFFGGDFFPGFGGALLILFTDALLCIGIGMVMGSLLTEAQNSAIGSISIAFLSIFSGAWTPLELMGGVFEKIAYALPFAHAVKACRSLWSGGTFASVAVDFYWVLAYAVVFLILGILAFRGKTMRK